ncbi:dipeptidase [Sphingosinicella microcystinivorans]|uniref:Membrane dipeptidase n=1 Tax=Sphingosinicella microcystinivorans TaxID=335406 RepID=A0AAD1D5I4_SPHMI|nr:membrane dipeptidase [Sphingosinicella microcystinivorans]RKS91223.1 membrane dipeptidase [Sphingosinicella microcystinivorans]BBE34192.1 membrane dipeptidase [Sphingosinicella microcystinivorans]
MDRRTLEGSQLPDVSRRTMAPLSRGRTILQSAIVWDNHACVPLRRDEVFLPELERFRSAGATIVSLNVGYADQPWISHIEILTWLRHWVVHQEGVRLVSTIADIAACKRDGVLGIVFDVEGMDPVVDRPELIGTFYDLGVRWMLVAYNRANGAGAGCLDDDTGLTARGRAIIDEMERVGMALCVSHTGHRTAREALDYARGPVIFSHSNPHGAFAHPRNIPDDLIVACATKGGVVGLTGFGPFLGVADNLVDELLRHIRYVVDLVGPDHVGLGLDYVFDEAEFAGFVAQNPNLFPADLATSNRIQMVAPEAIGEIADGLARVGLTDDQVRGVLGENWLRVASQVWK